MTTIPIQNIYYLLSYAWNKLEEKDKVKISIDRQTNLLDMFAKVLVNGTRILLKRGIDKYYVEHTEKFPGIKGKLQLGPTLKKALHLHQHTICTFDEYSADILINQIIYTTLNRFIHSEGLNPNLKLEIKKILRFFPLVSTIKLSRRHFITIRYVRRNRLYDFLLDVCELAFENSLPSEKPGEWIFKDFTRDENQMNKLFESFVRRFYQIKFAGKYDVGSRKIEWKLNPEKNGKEFLPEMKTDITLENKKNRIIIDAKFYQQTMNVYYSKEKIKSVNLYQLFAYLLNQEDNTLKGMQAIGILLYPTVQNEHDLEYTYNKHKIYIKTVNLNEEWQKIEDRLKEIISIP